MKFGHFIKNFFPDIKTDNFEGFYLEGGLNFEEKIDDISRLLSWPPNVFLIAYSLLDFTDKYRLIVSPQDGFSWRQKDNTDVINLTGEWKKLIEHKKTNSIGFYSLELFVLLENIFNKKTLDSGIYKLFDEEGFTSSLFKALLSIDELFSNVNICDVKYNGSLDTILLIRKLVLKKGNNLANNHSKFGVVTYKHSVPQTGLTLNNLTHNITCLKPSVKATIIANKLENKNEKQKSYNILFLPWPKKISSSSFTKSPKNKDLDMDAYFGFFDYEPKLTIKEKDFIATIIQAVKRVGTIDLIVLPECAMSDKLFNTLKSILFKCFKGNAPSLLSGVYGKDDEFGKNAASLAFIGETTKFDSVEQNKHHRWFLDQSQLRNYNLASALDPNKKWWENIKVNRRHLLSLHTENGIRLCPLICEDLARQEPVAQAVRSVGPNLVISLLLDGPQIGIRWPAKYSAVLSDDPGASVLSVSALGMTQRATGLGHKPSYEVALWSEPGKTPETLKLDEGTDGLIIELNINKEKMWTMDGRAKEKIVLRKLIHTSITIDEKLSSKTLTALEKTLMKELKRGS